MAFSFSVICEESFIDDHNTLAARVGAGLIQRLIISSDFGYTR
jgi:hypothetical protein